MSTPFLTMSQIAFQAEGRSILSEIDLTLKSGRVYGLVGQNGSGKSTLLKIMARQLARPPAPSI